MYLLGYLVVMIFMLLGVAFYTLVERRVLGCFHLRLGPSRVGPLGLFQPFGDAMKLFFKNHEVIRRVDLVFWNLSPLVAILMFLMALPLVAYGAGFFSFNSGVLYLFSILAGSVYFLVWGGFFSGSKYSVLGSYRAVSQMISYEIVLMFVFLGVTILIGSISVINYTILGGLVGVALPPLLIVWVVSCLAESNRLPFDFLEGESELVSGFNTEYWGGYFSFIFIFEYGFMILFAVLTSIIFSSYAFWYLVVMAFLYFYLWVRASLPRFRYDFLMSFAWKKLLVVCMGLVGYLCLFL